MSISTVRIATRKSPLALWQAEHVAALLKAAHPGIDVTLIPMSTRGDRILDAPLAKIGGKGLFVKELEQGMLEGSADIAVHSMKDVPVDFPEGLHLGAILEREDPTDAFVSNHYKSLHDLPQQARIGTSSLRRQCQITALRPDCEILSLRGNVNTRLARLDNNEFDAIILASAGLKRLGMADRITTCLPPETSLPAIGQGAIGIECRTNDTRIHELLEPLHHEETALRIRAERAMNARLQGGCQVPIAGHAIMVDKDRLWLRGLVGSADGSLLLRAEQQGTFSEAERMGMLLADDLLAQGADVILAALRE